MYISWVTDFHNGSSTRMNRVGETYYWELEKEENQVEHNDSMNDFFSTFVQGKHKKLGNKKNFIYFNVNFF